LREACSRQAEHHDGKESRHECAGSRITGKEAFEIARDAVVVAEQEPGDVVDDVVQPCNDEHAIQHAIGEQAKRPRMQDGLAQRVHAHFEPLPFKTEHRGNQQSGKSAGDGHEATATEECEVAGQPNVVETVVQGAGNQAGDDACRDAQLPQLLRLVSRNGQVTRGAGEGRDRVRRSIDQYFGPFGGDQITHHCGKPRRSVVFPSQTDRHAD
jgi:hypothetical protein